MTRASGPLLASVTRRTSASSSAEISTSMVVEIVPSRRPNSTRSSLNATSYSSGATPLGCSPADQVWPLSASRR